MRNIFAAGLHGAHSGLTRIFAASLPLIALGAALSLNSCAATKDAPSKTPGQPTSAANPPPAKAQSSVAPTQTLQDLTVREERGQTTLFVKFAQPVAEFRHFTLPQPARIVLDILNGAKAETSSDIFRIDTSVVSTVRLTASETNLRLVVEVAAATVGPYTISPEEGGLKIVVGEVNPNVNAKRNVVIVRGGQRLDVQQSAPAVGTDARSKMVASDDRPVGEKTYSGQKISLDFKDADIKNVFRLLAEVSGLNIVVTNDVNRRVTVRLVEVPWDQAMDLIITTNGLDKEQIGNVVRISTAGTLKAEKDALVAAKKSKEDLEPMQTVYYTLNYARAKDLEAKIRPLMSKRADNALVIDERSNSIMVRDVPQSIEDVSMLVGKFDLRTPQILIESNLIETNPTFARALGTRFNFTRGGATITSDFTPGAGTPAAGVAPIISVIQNRVGGLTDLTATLTAAENEGQVKIISRPSVVTLNNVPSTIRSERILRVTLPSSTNVASGSGAAAGTAVATEKIPVGINLTVIPQVSSDGFVLMNIKVKSSSTAPSLFATATVIPFEELNREAEANVLVRDGETIVIGGILKDSDTTSTAGIPYLKDIPVLGWLFKNWSIEKKFEELIVFITPRIASAGSENLPSSEQLWREQMKKTQGKQSASTPPSP